MASAVSIQAVSKVFERKKNKVVALEPVSLEIEQQEVVALLGSSGCGKSTLLRIISGLTQATSGRVQIAGETVDGPVTSIGFVFQQATLLDWLSIINNVMLQGAGRARLPKDVLEDRGLELLSLVGLGDCLDTHVYELSGGMQQRVALCRALVHRPPLLLMDEPFGALDALTRDQIAVDIQPLLASAESSVILVTHSIAEAVFLADRVVVMTPPPGKVAAIFDVPLERPRTLHMHRDSRYTDLVAEITEFFQKMGVLGS